MKTSVKFGLSPGTLVALRTLFGHFVIRLLIPLRLTIPNGSLSEHYALEG